MYFKAIEIVPISAFPSRIHHGYLSVLGPFCSHISRAPAEGAHFLLVFQALQLAQGEADWVPICRPGLLQRAPTTPAAWLLGSPQGLGLPPVCLLFPMPWGMFRRKGVCKAQNNPKHLVLCLALA